MNTLNDKNEILIVLPFEGFYNSIHATPIDWTIENIIDWDNDNGNEHASYTLKDSDDLIIDYKGYEQAYSKTYVELINSMINDKFTIEIDYANQVHFLGLDLKFDNLASPKYYNFETDRIFATIKKEEIRALASVTNMIGFAAYIKEHFTSYDGFISSYSGNLQEWLDDDIARWDHNQLGAMLSYLLEDARGTGIDEYWLTVDNANEIASEYITIKQGV